MKTDTQLQQDVRAAFKSDPILCDAEIGVSAKDGVITLTGTVDLYAKKMEAVELTKKVVGVKATFEDLELKNVTDLAENDGMNDFSRSCPINS
jgi:osmotically-inducible protein OsmY